jgi:hypothetical protein
LYTKKCKKLQYFKAQYFESANNLQKILLL